MALHSDKYDCIWQLNSPIWNLVGLGGPCSAQPSKTGELRCVIRRSLRNVVNAFSCFLCKGDDNGLSSLGAIGNLDADVTSFVARAATSGRSVLAVVLSHVLIAEHRYDRATYSHHPVFCTPPILCTLFPASHIVVPYFKWLKLRFYMLDLHLSKISRP